MDREQARKLLAESKKLSFKSQRYDERTGALEAEIHLYVGTKADLQDLRSAALVEALKQLRRGRVVIFPDVGGGETAYEVSDRRRVMYPSYGTPDQERIEFKGPWPFEKILAIQKSGSSPAAELPKR